MSFKRKKLQFILSELLPQKDNIYISMISNSINNGILPKS